MDYTVYVNESKRTVKVVLSDGYTGVAKCCPTDSFSTVVGTELALERAKVARADAEKKRALHDTLEKVNARVETKTKANTKKKTLKQLFAEVEEALPEGGIVVIGKGEEINAEQLDYLRSIVDEYSSESLGACDCECEDCGCSCKKDTKTKANTPFTVTERDVRELLVNALLNEAFRHN